MVATVVVLVLMVISIGIVQVLLGDLADLRRHGGGEQGHLLVRRGAGEDRLDVLGEPHLQHLVGLVEHEETQLAEVEGALLEVVHDPAGGTDDHLDAAAQGAQLDAVGLAAVDRQYVQAGQVGAVAGEGLADLDRELTGRAQHERFRRLLGVVEPGEDGQREGCGLAGAGLRPADDVAALEERRDGRCLDRGRQFVAEIPDRFQHTVVESEFAETGNREFFLGLLHLRSVVNTRSFGEPRPALRRTGGPARC